MLRKRREEEEKENSFFTFFEKVRRRTGEILAINSYVCWKFKFFCLTFFRNK